jgi:hypothetical protein
MALHCVWVSIVTVTRDDARVKRGSQGAIALSDPKEIAPRSSFTRTSRLPTVWDRYDFLIDDIGGGHGLHLFC